jgi:hypothetical protein
MRISYLIILLTVVFSVFFNVQADSHKQVVGATEVIQVDEASLSFKARVDTGAKTSSIHAEKIVVDSSASPRGKPITFYLVNKKGQSRKVETLIDSVIKVSTSEGSEHRYKVPLTIKSNYSRKTVLVTLNDRNRMQYGLLLGRNWLRGDFIVDVDRNNDE